MTGAQETVNKVRGRKASGRKVTDRTCGAVARIVVRTRSAVEGKADSVAVVEEDKAVEAFCFAFSI